MATAAVAPVASAPSTAVPFDRLAAVAAFGASASGLLYAVAFLVLRSPTLSALFLLLGAVLSTAVLVALHDRLARGGGGIVLLGLLLAVAGALGAAAHGAYDLANALHPPASSNPDLPSAVDPRGVFTFGFAGLGLACLAAAMSRSAHFPRPLARLGGLSAALSVVLYLGRLIVLDPASPVIALPAIVEGFFVNPAWYAWLGVVLWRMSHSTARAA